MPRSFPDMESLERAAQCHNFRQKLKSESEEDYRNALADHVRHIDPVESTEIRSGKGWNAQSPMELLGHLGLKL